MRTDMDARKKVAVGLKDSLRNLVTSLGTEKDKSQHGRFAHGLYGAVWLDKPELDAMYESNWLAGTIVDAPSDDMTRSWRTWAGGPKQVAAMEAAEKSLHVKERVNRAEKQSKLYGGAGILIGTGDANPEEPLDVSKIQKGGIKYLHTLSKWELWAGELDWDPLSENFGLPKYSLCQVKLYICLNLCIK